MKSFIITLIGLACLFSSCSNQNAEKNKVMEQYRPQYHFTPDSMWMNDPNGMVYYEGEYHLFYQFYPDSNVWGPMHWGHAVSTDLIHWEHLPVALYPDSLGWIFSGSAVVDWGNTSGLGTKDNPPLVAIYTHHNESAKKDGRLDFQNQSIAYSLDKGRTWIKYENNPVLPNPGIFDFRDPKVIWSEEFNKWIMVLAVKDYVSFYSSSDLKSWKHESDFGKNFSEGQRVWECPDLFKLKADDGTEKWVLIVSVGTGGPNGGSGTHYFVGAFDGTRFNNENQTTGIVWLDWGKDNYAGVTWSDIPKNDGRRIFIGWMSNWQYATKVPTKRWRSGMTLPRELKLLKKDGRYLLAANPVGEIESVLNIEQAQTVINIEITSRPIQLFKEKVRGGAWKTELVLKPEESKSISFKVKNSLAEEVCLTLNLSENKIEFDRILAGQKDFSQEFAVPISGLYSFESSSEIKLEIYWDENSFEIFVNNGEFQMTNLVFPNENWNNIELFCDGEANLDEATYVLIKNI